MSKVTAALLVATIASLFAAAAQAQVIRVRDSGVPSGNFRLKGNVASSCTISVEDLGLSLALKAGESAKKVGTVTETCNSGSGYKITLSSANAGQLKSGTNVIDYTIGYDNGSAVALTAAVVVDRATAQFAKKSDLTVTIAASDQYIAGDYADTVTVTIAAK